MAEHIAVTFFLFFVSFSFFYLVNLIFRVNKK